MVKIANLDVFCVERRRRFQQSSFTAIRVGFPGTVEKPVGEKLKLKIFHTVVIKNCFHFLESAALEDMFQIGMPDANASKTSPGGGFDPVFEIKAADFTGSRKSSGGRPIEIHEF